MFIMFSCHPAKNIPDGHYLLNKYKIECNNKKIDKEELDAYIKQKPNRRILAVFRFHLGIYNLFFKPDAKKIRRKIADIVGEEPVIYDEYLKEKSAKQLKIYLKNKGYYYAEVKDTAIIKNKKANVVYQIKTGNPYRLRQIQYKIEDYVIESIVLRDTVNSYLHKNKLFDAEMLQSERERISEELKNRGYFNFSKEYIYYQVDSNLNSWQVDITVGIKNPDNAKKQRHSKYMINNVYIFPEYDHKEHLDYADSIHATFDTIIINNINFIYHGKLKTNLKVILSANYIEKDDYYAKYNVDQTYKHLSDLKLFKMINISFKEAENNNNKHMLDCYILLTQFSKQSYIAELEGTNSSGNLGVAANLQYRHKSLLRGAEIYNFKIRGGIQQQTTLSSQSNNSNDIIDDILPFNTIEYGGETGIAIPQFWFINGNKSYGFVKKYKPKTNITIAYSYQKRPNYTRRIANLSYGYFWKSSKNTKHIVNPFEINLVDIPVIDSVFYSEIDNPYIKNSYKDYLITTTNYSFIYNNQRLNKQSNYMYLRANIEPAGNLLSTINKITKTTNQGNTYLVANRKYAQYMKTDIDIRLYKVLYRENILAYRFFAGIAYPYGNSSSIPFVKQFFSGGANSIRAWPVRALGPGSYDNSAETYNYQTGDIKLEANIEYRFKLLWMIEGALFVDAGNIWSVVQNDTRDGSLFDINTFYDDIAIGSGFGTRLDFTFFVFRFDFGVKVRDPAQQSGEKMVIFSRRSDFFKDLFSNVNIGIGYPF